MNLFGDMFDQYFGDSLARLRTNVYLRRMYSKFLLPTTYDEFKNRVAELHDMGNQEAAVKITEAIRLEQKAKATKIKPRSTRIEKEFQTRTRQSLLRKAAELRKEVKTEKRRDLYPLECELRRKEALMILAKGNIVKQSVEEQQGALANTQPFYVRTHFRTERSCVLYRGRLFLIELQHTDKSVDTSIEPPKEEVHNFTTVTTATDDLSKFTLKELEQCKEFRVASA